MPRERALVLLEKAAQDEALVEKVLTSLDISDEIIGFHCQQAAEKLLKALLAELAVPFARTHNIRHLMILLSDAGCPVPDGLQDMDTLTPFGTTFRYEWPQETEPIDRSGSLEMVRRLREWVEPQIPGSPTP